MKRTILLLILLIISLFLFACSDEEIVLAPDAPPDSVPDILGTYVVNGTDHLGNDYGGHLTITPGDNPNEYKFQWIIIESIQEGLGILDGNTLHIEWRSLDTSTQHYQGTVIYTVTVDGELYGTRTVENREGIGKEIAYPNK
jgi:hypothetical protein